MKSKILMIIDNLYRFENVLLLFLLFPAFALAQAVQPCVVKQYNQKDAKTPLAGVLVEVRGAGTEVSDAQGVLTLNFTTLKPGDRVVKRGITKDGYEIFNTSAVEQWTISRDRTPFQIVLVRSDYMRQLKQTLRNNSLENYKLKYEQTKKQLKKEQEAGKLKDEEYRKEMEKLEDQYDNALKDLDNYIDQFAHFDLNEVSAEEQRILDMVQQGQIDEAVKAYENLQLSEKLLQERADLKKLDEASARIEEEKARKEENISALREALDREITTLYLAGGRDNFEKITKILKEQALADTTDYEAVKMYADFAFEQNNYHEAEQFYAFCLNMELEEIVKYNLWMEVGDFYRFFGDYPKSEHYYRMLLEQLVTHFDQNPEEWRRNLAYIQNRMGVLYVRQREYAKSEEYYLDALEHYTLLFASDSNWLPAIAMIQHNLGVLYRIRDYFSKAEAFYLAALEKYKALFTIDSNSWRSAFAGIQNDLGRYYVSQKEYSKAEIYYLASLNLYSQDIDNWRSSLADSQEQIGEFYRIANDYEKSEEYYQAALENYSILFSQNPNRWGAAWAWIHYKLGCLYKLKENYLKAETHYLAALDQYTTLCGQDSTVWHSELSDIHYGLGDLYEKIGDTTKAEKHYHLGGKYYEIYLDQLSDSWLSNSAATHSSGGLVFESVLEDTSSRSKAENVYLATLEHYKVLFAQNPDFWRSDMANILKNLGQTYQFQENFTTAEEYYLAALEQYEILFEQKPDVWRSDLADIQDILGDLYSERMYLGVGNIGKSRNWHRKDYAKAGAYYRAALEHRKILLEQYPSFQRRTDLVSELYKLGSFYELYLKDCSKAEECYLAELEQRQVLFSQNPVNLYHLEKLADMHYRLGWFYVSCFKDTTKVEKHWLSELEYSKILVEQDTSENYRWRLSRPLEILGDFYASIEDYSRAEEYYNATLKLTLQSLEKQTDDTYDWRHKVASAQENLGYVYQVKKEYMKSEAYYLAALDNRKVIFEQDTNNLRLRRKELSWIQERLGDLYNWSIQDYSKANQFYSNALENKRNLMQQDTGTYCEDVVRIEWRLADINYFQLKKYRESEQYYSSAVEHCKWLYARNTANYADWLSSLYNVLSYAYAYQRKFQQALNAVEKAISISPSEPNYYDSKGEILLMSGNEKGALDMWQKVLELDPDFLKHLEEDGSASDLYKGLKEKGLVK